MKMNTENSNDMVVFSYVRPELCELFINPAMLEGQALGDGGTNDMNGENGVNIDGDEFGTDDEYGNN